jgi:hypothetical protein
VSTFPAAVGGRLRRVALVAAACALTGASFAAAPAAGQGRDAPYVIGKPDADSTDVYVWNLSGAARAAYKDDGFTVDLPSVFDLP